MDGQDETTFETSMQTFSENHHQYSFVQRGDRSLQAHINDAFIHLQYEQHQWDEADPTEEKLFISDFKHNDTPRQRKQEYPPKNCFKIGYLVIPF